MTHTPGPWHLERDSWVIRSLGTTKIATVSASTGLATMDNARLMAAAPDLLEACVKALDVLENMTTIQFSYGDDRPARDRLQAAIAKATGQKVPA